MRKRGVGIAELVIVLAVLAIISTIVTSFIVMSNEQVRSSNEKVDALNDIAVVESIIEGKIENYLTDGMVSDIIPDDSEKLIFRLFDNNGETELSNISLSFEDNKLYETSIEKNEKNELFECKTIKDIKFSIRDNENERLFICKVTYALTKNTYNYTFTVYKTNHTSVSTYLSVIEGIFQTTIDKYYDAEDMIVEATIINEKEIKVLQYVYAKVTENDITTKKIAYLYFINGKLYNSKDEINIETADILFENEIINDITIEKSDDKSFICKVSYTLEERDYNHEFTVIPYKLQDNVNNNQGDE